MPIEHRRNTPVVEFGLGFGRMDAATRAKDLRKMKRFATGLNWKDYMAQMGDTRARTESNYAKSDLTDDEPSNCTIGGPRGELLRPGGFR